VEQRRIIKHGPVVLATQEDGSIDPAGPSTQGLFLADTRYLSRLRVKLNDLPPVFMGSSEEILFEAAYLLTNPDLSGIPARAVGILWHNKIVSGVVHIDIRVVNWSLHKVKLDLSIEVDSDFYDSFEARGVVRLKRGELFPPKADDHCVELRYQGLDRVTRTTKIASETPISRWEEHTMHFALDLGGGAEELVALTVTPHEEAAPDVDLGAEPSVESVSAPEWFQESTTLTTDNSLAETILHRSIDDLQVLLTEYLGHYVPDAGLPRFAVPFGRDSIITGMQTLVWNPHLARNVLYFLAETQGKTDNPWNYEQPGKIMHEMHTGELARLKEIPFGLFYGSVDSTPLFLVLAAEYIRWTKDLKLYQDLKANFDAAWQWIDDYGDLDHSGYVQYKAHTPPRMSSAALTVGLYNQGWKDSANAVVYSTGEIVTKQPIALAEVQGDLFRALHLWAELYDTMPAPHGNPACADTCRKRAAALKESFNAEFWMPDKQYYAMALDGDHHWVDSITSNPAECLWSRLIDDEHAEAVAKMVVSPAMFSSWGIRTMANTEKAYNPFSYHNGSVWPFENSIILSGLKKYGRLNEAATLLDAMLDASLYFENRRWPEVYTGVSRERAGVLARQPDACSPQAWSAGAIFLILQTLLGVAPQAFSRRIHITPALPNSITELRADDINILGSYVSLRLVRQGKDILLDIRDNPDDLDIVVHPASPTHRHDDSVAD